MVKIRNIIVTALFICCILLGAFISIRPAAKIITDYLASPGTTFSETFEEEYSSVFTDYDITIDLYGGIQNILRKREVKNFDVVKDFDGQLYKTNSEDSCSLEEIKLTADIYQKLAWETENNGGDLFFVQVPYKNTETVDELRGYDNSHMDSSFTKLLDELKIRGVPTLDLRKYNSCCHHYKTDHHWTVESSFSAAVKTLEFLQENAGFDFDKDIYDLSNFYTQNYRSSFLGSNGIRVGKYYGGLDDFNLLIPNYETNFTYQHFIDGKITTETTGDFRNAFIDESILSDTAYHNKYNALLQGGYVENIITNHSINDSKKLLFISHSYGRPMAQYLSLAFSEVRYLDPQEGRYNDNYLTYVNEYKPDIVIVMYNAPLNIGEQ